MLGWKIALGENGGLHRRGARPAAALPLPLHRQQGEVHSDRQIAGQYEGRIKRVCENVI